MNERRSGEERRMEPPNCTVPCPPMVEQHSKFEKCLREVKETKVPNKLYYWSFGGLAFFVFIVYGAFQWNMLQNQHETSETFLRDLSRIKSDIAVSAEKVSRVGRDIDSHLSKSETKFETMERRIDNINKQHNKFLWDNRRK